MNILFVLFLIVLGLWIGIGMALSNKLKAAKSSEARKSILKWSYAASLLTIVAGIVALFGVPCLDPGFLGCIGTFLTLLTLLVFGIGLFFTVLLVSAADKDRQEKKDQSN